MTRIVLCCGTGGVGKTTTAAAVGVAWALSGQRACVLTIDPARRLADALGLDGLDNTPRPVTLDGEDVPEGGSLHAMMLDRKATFDDAIRRMAEDEASADRLLANRYYRAVSTKLTGSQEYMATEKLNELVQSGRFDVVIVDTPPSQHAIEFFHAPARIQKLFDGPVVRRLVQPGRGLTGGGTRRILRSVLSLVGRDVLEDIGEFFRLMSHASSGFADNSAAVAEQLRSDNTTLLLVTTPASAARAGALAFVEHAKSDGLSVDGVAITRFISSAGVSDNTWTSGPP
ncbi:MAG: ArsA family ATPase, partial [Myxococcota bacterium]